MISLRSAGLAIIVLFLLAAAAPAQWRKTAEVTLPVSVNASPERSEGRKSPLIAVLASLAVPGLGEWYVGDLSSGQYHLIAEGGLWLTYASLKTYAGWLRDDARAFATQNAGAQFSGTDELFEVNLGEYLSVEQYNQAKLRNRELDLMYASPAFQWQWQTDEQRSTFRGMRIRSDQVESDAKFVVAGLVINRLISAFGAARAAARHNRQAEESGAWNLRVRTTGGYAAVDGVEMRLEARL